MTDRQIRTAGDFEDLTFDDRGLVPVVVQDADSGAVLMLAWANTEALERTLETGQMHFWSRSREQLWHKGETSGNYLNVRTLHGDCDGDTVLARVSSAGPACHTGETTCFGRGSYDAPLRALSTLWNILEARDRDRPEGSYTARLLADENLRLKKLGEENAELILALARDEIPRAREEAADLLYHMMAALLAAGITLPEVAAELERRRRSRSEKEQARS